jgi:hypothetical protein
VLEEPAKTLIHGSGRKQDVRRGHRSTAQPVEGIHEPYLQVRGHLRAEGTVHTPERPWGHEQGVLRVRAQIHGRDRVSKVDNPSIRTDRISRNLRIRERSSLHDRYIDIGVEAFLSRRASEMKCVPSSRFLPMASEPEGDPDVVDKIKPTSANAIVLKERLDRGPVGARHQRTSPSTCLFLALVGATKWERPPIATARAAIKVVDKPA